MISLLNGRPALAQSVYTKHSCMQTVSMSSKWCCVLAVFCLSVILLSLDADAQPTVDDESSQCGSASLQQVANMVSVLASNQQAMMDEVHEIKDQMQENVVEMMKMRDEIKNESDRMRAEI